MSVRAAVSPNAPPSSAGVSAEKKRYTTPVLTRLGSVRELTLGHSSGGPDGRSGGAMGM
jgi:hypothetical protein